jgi:hypothetical protein
LFNAADGFEKNKKLGCQSAIDGEMRMSEVSLAALKQISQWA